jgi:hypothetical protein
MVRAKLHAKDRGEGKISPAGRREGLMSRPRAADDFKTIRSRMEELRRERLPERPAPAADHTGVAGHRGPCACGMSLFPDECDGSCKAL